MYDRFTIGKFRLNASFLIYFSLRSFIEFLNMWTVPSFFSVPYLVVCESSPIGDIKLALIRSAMR